MTLAQYLAWFDEVTGPTMPLFALVPPDKLGWKLTETSFSLGQLLNHIGLALRFNARIAARELLPLNSMREILVTNRRTPESSAAVAGEQYIAGRQKFIQALNAMGDDVFQTGMVDTPQKGRIEIWRFAAFVLEHHIHHLMELHIYLKVLGVKVNTRTLYSP